MQFMYDKFKTFRKYEIDKQIHVNDIKDIKNMSQKEKERFVNALVIGTPETGKTAPLIHFGKDECDDC